MKKILLAIAAVLMCVLVFCGCERSDTNGAQSGAQTSTEEESRSESGAQSDRRNLQLYFREIDHPQKYFRHVASIADPTTEATFDLISKDYLIINIGNDDLAVKYSE